MSVAIEEINGTNCKTYLLSCGADAALVDPVTVSHATGRILPDGQVLDVGLDLRLEIAVEQLQERMRQPSSITTIG